MDPIYTSWMPVHCHRSLILFYQTSKYHSLMLIHCHPFIKCINIIVGCQCVIAYHFSWKNELILIQTSLYLTKCVLGCSLGCSNKYHLCLVPLYMVMVLNIAWARHNLVACSNKFLLGQCRISSFRLSISKSEHHNSDVNNHWLVIKVM
jgi:hypothetical protein